MAGLIESAILWAVAESLGVLFHILFRQAAAPPFLYDDPTSFQQSHRLDEKKKYIFIRRLEE